MWGAFSLTLLSDSSEVDMRCQDLPVDLRTCRYGTGATVAAVMKSSVVNIGRDTWGTYQSRSVRKGGGRVESSKDQEACTSLAGINVLSTQSKGISTIYDPFVTIFKIKTKRGGNAGDDLSPSQDDPQAPIYPREWASAQFHNV